VKRVNPVQIVLYLLLVFASGALVGAFGHKLYSANAVSASPKSPRPDHKAFREKYIKDHESRLKLDASQTAKLGSILDDTNAKFKAARDRNEPEMKQIQQEMRDRIREMLSADQKPEYEKMLKERELKRQRERERGGSPGGY
jgi:Spy/CpxP family protein refolding chaperone